ncbi:hypothetical protein V499_03898 [Pseudogymnoascus sp. VKM F-103]|nr:hypothetical protein V499_03898 [Pseudogymnoascus sp. VKM F-103]
MADDSERPIRALSLDGGGVRGLSAILILDHIMRNINTQRKADGKDPQEPWEYFDLMGGTSTGGIIAIMLGRLRMTIPECIKAYTELSKAIFTPRHSRASPVRGVEYLNGDGKFDSLALEREIKNQIRKSKVAKNDDQILLQDPESPCKVCVFALRESNSKLAILRTYDYLHASQTLFDECKVWEACRATSAAPTFFDPVQIGQYKQSFIDGGLGYNNPIFKVYDEAQNIWPDRTVVATSIGTGEVPGTAFGGNLKKIAESITKIVTGCDVVADDFYNANKVMVAEERYCRLSVTHGLGNIGLEEHKHIGEIVDQTQEYLSRGEPQAKLKQCIKALLQERVNNGNDIYLLSGLQTPETCLESLQFKEMNFRKENIVNADDNTCGWLLENENYACWIQNTDGLLWIQGKAGAGKSTLMKYIYEKIQMPTVSTSSLKLSFFFHARGTELQKTPLGMFKSLLLQLYKGDSTARTGIIKEFNKNSEEGMVNVKWEWTEKMLEELFSSLICQISQSKKVTIFIDALDEAGEVIANDLATYLASLYEKVQHNNGIVKICFSSRHYPIVSTRVAENQKVIVEHENGRGIRLFIQREFEQNLQDDGPIKSKAMSLKLEDDIAAKANGVFQWVCLVLPIIFKADREAEPLGSIQNILYDLPKDLNDMYRYILQALISQKQKTGALKLFRWVCFAARPLSLEEIRHAMAVVDSLPPLQLYHLKDSSEYVEYRMETRITALSGGLIEVREHDSGTVVQVNHQTVRDFLLEEGFEILTGLKTPSDTEKKKFEGSCHDILARSCVNYLWTEDVQQHSTTTIIKKSSSKRTWIQLPALETLPLLQYAIAAYFWHASKAEQNGHYQETLLDQFDYKHTYRFPKRDIVEQGLFSLWCSAGKIFCPRDYLGVLPSESSTLLHIASMANIPTAVRSLLKKKVKVSEKDNLGQQAIHYAARGGATEAAGILIKFSSSVINAKDNNALTPLQIASRHYKADVLRLLISKGATIKCFDKQNSTKLGKVRGNVEKTVSLLLEDGAKFNAQSLQSAAADGNLEAVRLLLAEGTDVNGLSGEYGYALVAAAHNGHEAMALGLLKNGAEVNAHGGIYGCALVAAAESGDEKMVYILLQAGAEVNAKGGKYAGALEAAAAMGHANMVKILLKRGANVNTQKGKYGGALASAACAGHAEVVEILVEGGANINAQIGTYDNALTAAVSCGHEAVVKILLERGAKPDALSGGKTNPLAIAAMGNHFDIAQALLKAKAKCKPFLAEVKFFGKYDLQRSLELVLLLASLVGRLDIVDGIIAFNERNDHPLSDLTAMNYWLLQYGRLNANAYSKILQYNGYTALQLSAAGGHPEVAARLITAGSDVNDFSDFPRGHSALQVAAKHGHLEVVKILLTAGANVRNIPVFYGQGLSALQLAAKHGHLEIVKTLLTAGANVEAALAKHSETALQTAVRHGHLKIVELLLDSKANPNATPHGDQGPTALEIAAEKGNLEAVDMLLKAGADVDAPGLTYGPGAALHGAACHGHTDVIARLIAGGADVNLRAPDGYRAIYRLGPWDMDTLGWSSYRDRQEQNKSLDPSMV